MCTLTLFALLPYHTYTYTILSSSGSKKIGHELTFYLSFPAITLKLQFSNFKTPVISTSFVILLVMELVTLKPLYYQTKNKIPTLFCIYGIPIAVTTSTFPLGRQLWVSLYMEYR
jgi:hypothetical protein